MTAAELREVARRLRQAADEFEAEAARIEGGGLPSERAAVSDQVLGRIVGPNGQVKKEFHHA